MIRIISTVLILGAGAFVLAACSGKTAHAPVESASVYEVTDAVITVIPGAQGPAKGTLKIKLAGIPAHLVSVTSAQAEAVELHTMDMADGVMRMRMVGSLEITEAAPLVLGHHGAHLMVFGLSESIAPDESVELLMHFRNADGKEDTLAVAAIVAGPGE